ncbi:hypothetical protein DL96DRAFT_1577199 [Flagelloscypha sp. PMI_526]|nr:hypothetical protein DL96DRAFT_1577199 [Flagelloscypha sp. PMI_526]
MLTVDFPPEWQGRNSQLILRPHDFYLDGAVRVLVDPTHRDYLSDSPLFISLESHGHEDIPKFALKFAFRGDFLSSLEFENAVYNLLKPLQGTVIPRSLGLFMCEKQDDSIGCLALEYWGSTLSQPFYTLPLHLNSP